MLSELPKTPFFVFNPARLLTNLKNYERSLPKGTEVCYSLKANSQPEVLSRLVAAGSSFELANRFELEILKKFNPNPKKIILGSAIKQTEDIKAFFSFGVDRFALDSREQLLKISEIAPGSRVYVRTLVDDRAESVFHMSKKFGTSVSEAIQLLREAKALGLVPYGFSFNVGSQAKNADAWGRGIRDLSIAIENLAAVGIKIQMIDLGGGFPQGYKNDKRPGVSEISKHIKEASANLPYEVKFIVEPGRGLVANTYDLVVSVIERIEKPSGVWIHVDAGVYNGLLEAMAYQGKIRYRVEPFDGVNGREMSQFILTGPTCDDLDIIDEEVFLPADITIGEKLIVRDVGAYSFTLVTPFNAFPRPEVVVDP